MKCPITSAACWPPARLKCRSNTPGPLWCYVPEYDTCGACGLLVDAHRQAWRHHKDAWRSTAVRLARTAICCQCYSEEPGFIQPDEGYREP